MWITICLKTEGLVLKDNMQYFTFLQSLYIENWASNIEILYLIVSCLAASTTAMIGVSGD